MRKPVRRVERERLAQWELRDRRVQLVRKAIKVRRGLKDLKGIRAIRVRSGRRVS